MADVPSTWEAAMIAAGCVDPRRKEDVASMSQLAERTGLTTETIRRMIRGIGRPDPSSVKKVAEVLGDDVFEWVVIARYTRGPWEPPEEAFFLSDEEGRALTELIRVMTAGRGGRRTSTPGAPEHWQRRVRELRRAAGSPTRIGEPAGQPVELGEAAMEDRRPDQAPLPPPGTSEEPDT